MAIVAIGLADFLAACIGDPRIKITYMMLRSHKCVDHLPIRLHSRPPAIAFYCQRIIIPKRPLLRLFRECEPELAAASGRRVIGAAR